MKLNVFSSIPAHIETAQPIIDVTNIQAVTDKNGLLGFATVVINKWFYVSSIAILSRKEGGYRVSYPLRTLANGKRIAVFYPVDDEFAKSLEEKIIEEFLKATKFADENSWSWE